MRRWRGIGRIALPAVGVLIIGLSLPYWLITNSFVLSVCILAVIWAIAGQGWNVGGGYGGLLSFGHSVFFGLGAYTTAILQAQLGVTPWLGMLVGAAVSAIAGAILTFPALRLKGVYFTIGTFVLSLLLTDLAIINVNVTGGDQGILLPFIQGTDPGMFKFDPSLLRVNFYFVLVGFLAVATLIVALVANSRLGLFLRASRDDAEAARAAGVNVTRVRLLGLMISAAITSIAGSLYLEYVGSITPLSGFGAMTAFIIAMVALVGGKSTILGPIVGAAVIIPVQQMLTTSFSSTGPLGLSGMVYAAIVIVIMLIDPKGILNLLIRLFNWLWRLIARAFRRPPTPSGGAAVAIDETGARG